MKYEYMSFERSSASWALLAMESGKGSKVAAHQGSAKPFGALLVSPVLPQDHVKSRGRVSIATSSIKVISIPDYPGYYELRCIVCMYE